MRAENSEVGSSESRVRAQYEEWLSRWTPVSLYVRWYLRHGGPRFAAPLFEAMGAGPFPRLLDVGCAAGVYLRWAFEQGHGSVELAGIDITPALLAEAADRLEPARAAGACVVLHEASAVSLPFTEASFDALICNGVVKYLDETMLDAFLSEALRVLAPGGRIALADFGRAVPVQSSLVSPCPPRHTGGAPEDRDRAVRVASATGLLGSLRRDAHAAASDSAHLRGGGGYSAVTWGCFQSGRERRAQPCRQAVD